MQAAQIDSITIHGFRSFGAKPQSLTFSSPIAVVWGPNSRGKTSLAEAFEFLLTGKIVRRELLASTRDEFADALRNTHLPDNVKVYVEADFIGLDGNSHKIRRTLLEDYGKKQDCRCSLHIDGKPADEKDLRALGIVLSQPPLEAPILSQHTLAYLFSIPPQARADYFKTMLEVNDLEQFRIAVAGLEAECTAPANALVTKLQNCANASAFSAILSKPVKPLTLDKLSKTFQKAAEALLQAERETPQGTLEVLLAKIEELLADKRARAFPMQGFQKTPLAQTFLPDDTNWKTLADFEAERAKVDEHVRQLVALFQEALKLHEVKDAHNAVDCPLCATPLGLTLERITLIREHVQATEAYQKAKTDAEAALNSIEQSIRSMFRSVVASCPQFIRWKSKERRTQGFNIDNIKQLLGVDDAEVFSAWLRAAVALQRAYLRQHTIGRKIGDVLNTHKQQLEAGNSFDGLKQIVVSTLSAGHVQYMQALDTYSKVHETLHAKLAPLVDSLSKTQGWQDFIDLGKDLSALYAALVDKAAYDKLLTEFNKAIKEIDAAKESVFEEKFGDLSDDIRTWWDLLRPDEHTFFHEVKPRPKAKRTVDFKAGLSPHDDRSAAKVRDVIAIFSQSQLHCLGLAVFIARAVQEGSKFIVLDDPVLTSDEDYTLNFTASVLEKLTKMGVQVIMTTQDQGVAKDLEERYRHLAINIYLLSMEKPADGTFVEDKFDDLGANLNRIRSLANGGHPDNWQRGGELLRNATERFCKEMLIKERRGKGEALASLTDYDGKDLSDMCPKVETLLSQDASHAGKLRAIPKGIGPAKHDHKTPAQGTLKQLTRDLEDLRNRYLKSGGNIASVVAATASITEPA